MLKHKKMPIVGAVMTSFPYFIEIEDTAAKIERMMDQHTIRHLPVQENGKIVGIVSERDLHHYVKAARSDQVFYLSPTPATPIEKVLRIMDGRPFVLQRPKPR